MACQSLGGITFFMVYKIMVSLAISGILDLMRSHVGIIPTFGDNGVVHVTKGSFQDYLLAPYPPDSFFPLILKNKRQFIYSSW